MDIDQLVPFFCNICDFLSNDLTVIKKHKETHTKQKAHSSNITSDHAGMAECLSCSKKYTTKYKLKLHFENIHEGVCHKTATCNSCGKKYTSGYKLKVHIESVHKGIRHFCDQCGTSHKTRRTLRSHILVVHEKQQKKKQKRFKCEECNRSFEKIFTNCKDHIKTCEKCGYITNFRNNLQNHQSSSHCKPSKSKKTIMCGKCSDLFTTIKYMKKHELSHTYGKPYKCSDCGVGFSERFNIKKHKRKNCKGVTDAISN